MSKNKNKTDVVLTERQQQELKEAKSIKRMTFTFVVVIILCAAIFATSLLAAPVEGLVNRATKAVTIGDHTLTGVELNYFYVDAIKQYYQNYYSYYGSYFSAITGISTSNPLDEQTFDKTTGQTWADYFVELALDNAKSTYALYDEAMKQGFKLSDEDQKDVDELIDNLEENIDYYRELYQSIGYTYNYKNATDFLVGSYGRGASTKSYKSYYEVCTIANAYYTEYYDGQEYSDADLRAYEKDKMSDYSSFTYNYYLFAVDDYLEGGTVTKGEDGKETTTYSDEEREAARAAAEGLANKLAEGSYETLEDFDNALDALLKEYAASKETETSAEEAEGTTGTTEPDATEPTDKEDEEAEDEEKEDEKKTTSTPVEDKLGSSSSVNSLFIEWLENAERKEGDLTVIEYATGEDDEKEVKGYYVVRFTSVNDNTYALINIRHILVEFEGGSYNSTTGQTTYSDAEKKAAKEAAEKLLEQWKNGEATEDSFSKLANEESDDPGSNTNGGLYEDVYPGQMVTNFNDWCFEEGRAVGDTGVVEGTSGYHVMYFAGFSETNYRDFMVDSDLRDEKVNEWHEALLEAITCTLLTDKRVNKGITMSEVTGA